MAWDTDYALEGIFTHGGPLNVHQYEIDSGKFGQSTETYHVIHFRIDNNNDLFDRLREKMTGEIIYYPIMCLLRRGSTKDANWKQELVMYRAWLFSLTPEHHTASPPFYDWGGNTLGLGAYKKDNPHIHSTDW